MKTEGETEPLKEDKLFFTFALSLFINIYLAFYSFEVKREKEELLDGVRYLVSLNVFQEEIIKDQDALIKNYEKMLLIKAQNYAKKD